MQTYTLATKHPNYFGAEPQNIEATVIRTYTAVKASYMFWDGRQLTANNWIQEQKLASTKNGKGIMDYCLN